MCASEVTYQQEKPSQRWDWLLISTAMAGNAVEMEMIMMLNLKGSFVVFVGQLFCVSY